MDTGWVVSLIVTAILIGFILFIAILMDRKHIIRENGRINYKRTEIFLRWNVFDSLSLLLGIYTIICVQILNFLISSGKSVENGYVQFFINQAQAWIIVSIAYLVSRISMTLKAIKARWGDEIE